MSRIDLHNYEAYLLDYSEGNLNAEDLAALNAFAIAHPELGIDLSDFSLPYISEKAPSVDFKSELKKDTTDLYNEDLLNYLEGNLSPEQLIAFEGRLAGDKTLAAELEQYKKTLLEPGAGIIFEGKGALLKTEDDLILNNPVIAHLEGKLTGKEKLEFESALKTNKELGKEFELYSKTILTADASVIYPDKEELKKQTRVIALFNYRTVAAMAAATLLLFGFVFIFNYYNSGPPVKKEIAKTDDVVLPKGSTVQPVLKDSVLEAGDKQNSSKPLLAKTSENKTTPSAKSYNEGENKVEPEQAPMPKDLAIQQPEEKTPVLPVNEQKSEDIKTELANQIKSKNTFDTLNSRQTTLIAIAEEIDEEEEAPVSKNKKGFWSKAVQLAKQANKLGVKSIDGQEDAKEKYRLSFNSFSVEKK
jgi:hypothetical protein